MKSLFENISILISSLFTTSVSIFAQKPLYDTEFINQLKDDDLAMIEEKVAKLRIEGNSDPTEVTLKNKNKITIMVN